MGYVAVVGFAELRISGFGSGCWRWWFGLLLWFGYILAFAGFLILMWGWYNIHYCVFAALAFCGFGVRVIRAGLV